MKVYCLFEQSGTFKNEFKKLGYDAFDIDIENRFKQTDIIEDLFSSIRNENGIFEKITKDDLVLSFFPCIRFSTRVLLNARGLNAGMKNWDNNKKLDYSIKTVNEINIFYSLWCKMFQISLNKGFKMIVENPFTKPNVLSSVFPINPTIVDMDRREMGDYVKKPTCYWFVNCEPKDNYINDIIVKKEETKIISNLRGIKRSLISSDYAKCFIKKYIL